MRDTLDKFQPAVFDRSLAELIAATSPRRDAPKMSGANRRRLRKLAHEYVRPGVHVTDLHEALRRIQQQRILWQRFVAAGVVPEVPVGIADVQVACQRVAEDLAALDVPLGASARRSSLPSLPIAQLDRRCSRARRRLRRARQPAGAHRAARRAARPRPRPAARRPVATPRAREPGARPSSSSPGGSRCSRPCSRATAPCSTPTPACSTGSRPTSGSSTRRTRRPPAQLLAWQLAETWKIGVVDWPDEADGAQAPLLNGDRTTAETLQRRRAAPVAHARTGLARLAVRGRRRSPTDLAFDTVILVDAGRDEPRRERRRHPPRPPDRRVRRPGHADAVAVRDRASRRAGVDADARRPSTSTRPARRLGARAARANCCRRLTLTRSYRAGGEDLAELVNRRFYGGQIDSLPWAGSFLGHGSLTLDYVEGGHGMPDADTGAVESVDAEVDQGRRARARARD